MEDIPKNKILEHPPDILSIIRKEYNLDNQESMADIIRILTEWLKKQRHFKKTDFSSFYLETTIIMCKGSIERAKTLLDRMCTLRTLLPQFFGVFNVKNDFGIMFDVLTPVVLPKLTPDHYRVYLVKINDKAHLIKDYLNFFIYNLIIAEYLKCHDYCRGFYVISDFTETNMMDFLTSLNSVQIRQALTIFIEGYGMRIKGIHLFTPSKMIESVIGILKQVTSPKISARIHSHKNLKILPDIVPLDILPEDYGGKERPLRTIFDEWREILSSKENLDYLKDITQAGTDESYRQVDKFNEQYAGMPGTFRLLSVD